MPQRDATLYPYCGPAWTIPTLTAFYLTFPFILPGLQKIPANLLPSLTVV